MAVPNAIQTKVGTMHSSNLQQKLRKKSWSPPCKTIIMGNLWVLLVKRKLRKSLKK